MTMNRSTARRAAALAAALVLAAVTGRPAAAGPKPPVPDLTAGGAPLDDKTITLGPTGMRGWVWGWQGHTRDARQILVTRVADGSPAAGRLAAGDVIVGLDGKAFTADARVALGRAITAAEAGDGRLALRRWRKGATDDVVLDLPVLGRYGPTAPTGCEKSRQILDAGCAALAARGFRDGRGRIAVTIPNDLGALALLASGAERHLPLVKEYADAVAQHRPGGHVSWGYAYETLFLAEYVLATGDDAVKPGLERLALDIARGQSAVGTWGHAFARPEGNLNGYGCMNQPGIVLTLALVIAREAGVSSPDLDTAIARSERFLQWYVGKGAIPYGDHAPWPDHDDNGKCSSAAVLFDLLGRADAATFFARMATAAHAERESGHTGNFFNVLWALPGVSRAGAAATGAYLAETAWYHDLARDHEGRFTHQGIPGEPDKDQYGGWDTTGAMLLAFALPARRTALTGRRPSTAAPLTGADLAETIADGAWNFWDGQETVYDPRSTADLMRGIASWSPAVRLRSAQALARKPDVSIAALVARLADRRPETRYGACVALRFLGPRGDAAAPELRRLLRSDDPWDRVMAAEALVEMSDRVRNESLVPLLEVVVRRGDDPADPRRCVLGPLAEVLFKPGPGKREPRSILAGSLDLVEAPHRPLLVAAVREVMHSQDGRIRGGAAAVYGRLAPGELAELMPDILETIRTPAPSGEMFAYDIRMRGLEVLAQHRIREGMELAVAIMNEKRWGRDFARAARALEAYGGAAAHLLPELEGPVRRLVADEGKGRPEALEKAIRTIKADRAPKPVVSAADFAAARGPATAAPRANSPWKKPSMAFFPLDDRSKSHDFRRSSIAASSGGRLVPQSVKGRTVSQAAPRKPAPVRVYVLAGQSNMEGHGEVAARPDRNGGRGSLEFLATNAPTAATFGRLRNDAGGWAERDDVWIEYLDRSGPLTVGYGARDGLVGPELGFGTVVGDAVDVPVLLVKCAWGGKSLAIDFRPPSAGRPGYPLGEKLDAAIAADPGMVGKYYRDTVALVKRALERLDGDGLVPGAKDRGHVLAGFAWHQGWNDRINDRFNAEYGSNLAHFIRDIRRDLAAPGLPFVIAETGMTGPEEKHPRALALMTAQAAVAALPEFRGTVAFVPTREFWRPADQSPADQGYHWNRNAETYWLIGAGLGRAMLALAP